MTWILEPSNDIPWNILENSVRFCDKYVILQSICVVSF